MTRKYLCDLDNQIKFDCPLLSLFNLFKLYYPSSIYNYLLLKYLRYPSSELLNKPLLLGLNRSIILSIMLHGFKLSASCILLVFYEPEHMLPVVLGARRE